MTNEEIKLAAKQAELSRKIELHLNEFIAKNEIEIKEVWPNFLQFINDTMSFIIGSQQALYIKDELLHDDEILKKILKATAQCAVSTIKISFDNVIESRLNGENKCH